MAPMHTVTSKGIKEPQFGSQTSRWDAILREGDTGRSATTRQQPHVMSRGKCHASNHRGRGGQLDVKFRTNNSDGGSFNWRQRAANDSVAPWKSAEDGAVMEAIEMVRDSMNSYLHENQCGTASEYVHIYVLRAIEQLAASIFHGADTKQCLGRHFLSALNSIKTLPNVSNAIVLEAGWSLIQQMHLLSELPPSSCRLICTLSFTSFHCLQSLTCQPQQLRRGKFNAQKNISNFDAYECLSMLVEILGFDVFNNKLASTDEVMKCKSTLMSCIAITLSVTTNHSSAPPLNKRDVRCSLIPWGAEKMVNIIVKETVLPFMEVQLKGMDGSNTSMMNLNYCDGAMECIYILLRDPKWETTFETVVPASTAQLSKYANAILAPLIVDILPDGEEKHHANPLRSKILSLICTYWDLSYEYIAKRKRSSDESTHQSVIMLMPCQCMAAALNALSALRKSKPQNRDDFQVINFSNIARQLQSMIHNEDLRSYRPKFLSIMALLGLAYPSAFANQWHIFLEQSPANEAALLSITDKGSTALASEKFDNVCWIALPNALHAISVFLTAMPFALWISSGEAKTLTQMSGGNFSKRIRTALLDVINCICKLMLVVKEKLSIAALSESSMEVVMRLVSELAGKFCTILPFNGENAILLDASVRILQCAGDIYVNSVPATKLAVEIFGSVITESLGNKSIVSDNESVAKISAPATAWLSSATSFDFIGLLLTDSRWPCPSSRERMLMLSKLARSSPATLVREPFNLALFCEVCTVRTQDEYGLNSSTLGLKLIESFIYGRKTCLIECTTHSVVDVVIRQNFIPLLLIALNDSSAAIRTCAVSSFAWLLRRDWLEYLDSFADSRPLESILKLCSSKHENVASVRAASCKAIGDIVISCTFQDEKYCNDYTKSLVDSSVFTLACKVCEVMKIAIVDKNAAVRSMVRNVLLVYYSSLLSRLV